VFAAPLGDGRMPVVAREDLADVAARVAAEVQADLDAGGPSRHAGRTYELEGDATLGGDDIAATLAEVLGTPVRYETAPLGAVRAQLSTVGLEPYQVGHTVSQFSNVNAGMLRPARDDLPALLGTSPRPALAVLADVVRAGLKQAEA